MQVEVQRQRESDQEIRFRRRTWQDVLGHIFESAQYSIGLRTSTGEDLEHRIPVRLVRTVDGSWTNVETVEFPVAWTAWGTIDRGMVCDADGQILLEGPLTVALTINSGDQLRMLPGEINARFEVFDGR